MPGLPGKTDDCRNNEVGVMEKKVVEIIDSLDGPALVYDDGTEDRFPVGLEPTAKREPPAIVSTTSTTPAEMPSDVADPEDLPPPPLSGDVNFEERRGGGEVWYSDWLARDHEDLVEESAAWLEQQPGVERVIHDDLVVLMVDGRWDAELRRALKVWWNERMPGLDLN